jgi:transcriptional regulator with XRE-family HTH domain
MYGKLFRSRRLAHGLTISQLSRITGVSRRFLSAIETDEANISIQYLTRVANALGIDEVDFRGFRVRFDGMDVTGVVLADVIEALDKLEAIRALLMSAPREMADGTGEGAAPDDSLIRDLLRTRAPRDDGSLAESPFAGRYVAADALPRSGNDRTLWSAEWFLPVDQFVPVAYSYPEVQDARFLIARILDDSMRPALKARDVVRIDTAVRAPKAGDLVAVHGMVSGSVLGVLQDERLPLLVRSNAEPVAIWRERFTIQGVVSRVA